MLAGSTKSCIGKMRVWWDNKARWRRIWHASAPMPFVSGVRSSSGGEIDLTFSSLKRSSSIEKLIPGASLVAKSKILAGANAKFGLPVTCLISGRRSTQTRHLQAYACKCFDNGGRKMRLLNNTFMLSICIAINLLELRLFLKYNLSDLILGKSKYWFVKKLTTHEKHNVGRFHKIMYW